MMTRGYVQSQLDKLHQFPEYLEIIQEKKGRGKSSTPAPPEPQPGTSSQSSGQAAAASTQEEAEEPVSKRTRTGGKTPLSEKTQTPGAGKLPEPKPHLAGVGEMQADPYNLADMGQVLQLIEFLTLNGEWELFLTPKDGQCLFAAFRRGMEAPEEYRSGHLRNQLIFWCVKNHGLVYTILKNDLLGEYGLKRLSKEEYEAREDSEENPLTKDEIEMYHKPGPFSFYSYLSACLDPTFWGDGLLIQLASMMWQVGISVIAAETLDVTRIRHSHTLEDTDLLLIRAGDSHYLGACKYNFWLSGPCRMVRQSCALVRR